MQMGDCMRRECKEKGKEKKKEKKKGKKKEREEGRFQEYHQKCEKSNLSASMLNQEPQGRKFSFSSYYPTHLLFKEWT